MSAATDYPWIARIANLPVGGNFPVDHRANEAARILDELDRLRAAVVGKPA